ncbi:hypothetical protein AKO1_007929 [Acrasis kona]|uniref:Uncharacterized protein n=1 Tax=Acrasis kona TaxID=1008807 RepID=A0AAW2YPS3_9EUKA
MTTTTYENMFDYLNDGEIAEPTAESFSEMFDATEQTYLIDDLLPAPVTLKTEEAQDLSDDVVVEDSEPEPEDLDTAEENGWEMQYSHENLTLNDQNSQILIKVRSRAEDEQFNVVPECLYSSLRYNMILSIDPNVFSEIKTTLVMAHITVVDQNGVEVTNKNGDSVVKGPREHTPLNINRDTSRLECSIPVRFSSVSFHHSKRKFTFLVSLYDFENKTTPLLLSIRSQAFLTYARRPKVSERAALSSKNKVNTAICKKRKSEGTYKAPTSCLTRYMTSLEQLLSSITSFDMEQKKMALQEVSTKLFI